MKAIVLAGDSYTLVPHHRRHQQAAHADLCQHHGVLPYQ